MTATLEKELDLASRDVGGLSRLRDEARAIVRFQEAAALMRRVVSEVPPLVERGLSSWRALCADVINAKDAGVRPDREEWARNGRKMAELTGLAITLTETLAADTGDEPAELPALRKQAKEVRRLNDGLEGWKTDGDLLSLAVRWFPIDREAFSSSAKTFVPTQAMYDEDWD